ncbi:MAG: TolC family protein [Candidatus Cloacimonadales bacterium]|nr:TolC family protein [Candidatus Cloacimonadota bacterium]MDD2650609.1 TolC family protein [Candidatus Cloacimonadota bacterium]MDD3502456.1 TolC family protein [Candidatus Cloacimonadota bacterium]MDX9977740.1 TolC family protein [Candidatus Cloacimonadales bacterium]
MRNNLKTLSLILLFISMHILSFAEGIGLEEARRLAKENNKASKGQEYALKSAEANKKASFTEFLPSIQAAGTYAQKGDTFKLQTDLERLPVYEMDPNTGVPEPVAGQFVPFQIDKELGEKNSYLFNISLTQPIFMGGKVVTQYKMHKNIEELERNKLQLSNEDLIVNVDQAYWQVVTLQEKLKLAEQYKSNIERHLHDLENYKAVGIITQNDVLKAQVKLNEADLTLLKVSNGLKLAKMAFNQTIGIDLEQDIILTDQLTIDEIKAQKPDIENALKRRPEIQMLNTTVKLASNNQSLHLSRYMPNLVLNASYNFMNPNPYNSFKDECGKDWTISLIAQLEIFHWNERGYRLSAANSMKKAACYKLDDAKEMMNLEIIQSENHLHESQQKAILTQLNLEQTQENLEYCNDKFQQGILKSADVLDAQTLWQKAQSDHLDTLAELKINQIKYAKAIGELVQN